jgi:hypothetical protein
METKSLFKSKTLIVNAIIALAALYPPVAEWVSGHAALALSFIGGANMLLRLITKNRLSLFASE